MKPLLAEIGRVVYSCLVTHRELVALMSCVPNQESGDGLGESREGWKQGKRHFSLDFSASYSGIQRPLIRHGLRQVNTGRGTGGFVREYG